MSRMPRMSGAAAVTLLAACAAGGTGAAPAAPEWDSIAFEVNSWGRPVVAWTVNSDGAGTWSETVGENSTPRGPYRVEHHALAPDPDGFRKLAVQLTAVPDPAPTTEGCDLFATDMPYGTLRLTAAGATREVSFNDGCRDAPYRAFMQILHAADAQVGEWGRAAPVSRSESFPN